MPWPTFTFDALHALGGRLLAGRIPDNLPPRASLDEIRQGWRFETTNYSIGWALVTLALLVAAVVGWSVVRRALQGMRPPNWAFLKAAKKVGLSRADAWMLWRVARAEGLPSGLTLLLSEGTLRHHGLRFLRALPPGQRQAVAARLADIEARLFRSPGLRTPIADPRPPRRPISSERTGHTPPRKSTTTGRRPRDRAA